MYVMIAGRATIVKVVARHYGVDEAAAKQLFKNYIYEQQLGLWKWSYGVTKCEDLDVVKFFR